MDIQITITNPTPEVIIALAAAVSHGQQAAAAVTPNVYHDDAPVAPVTEEEPEKPAPAEKPKRQRAPKQEPAAVPQEEETEKEPEPESAPEPIKSESAQQQHIPDVVEIRAKAQEIGKTADGKKAIKALLDKFGCASLSAIPDDKRADFMAELEQLV